MQTVRIVLQKAAEHLKECGIEDGRRRFEEVLAATLGVKRLELYMDIDRPLHEDELQRLRQGLSRLAKHEPWQHIIGTVDFYDCTLQVNQDVLIPRQETEILADMIAKGIGEEGVLWDICAGSGCLGLSLKKKFPKLQVSLSDISEKALAVAKRNASANDLEVNFCQGDLLTPFAGKKADYIVCNPPYIGEGEKLEPEVADFEPKGALISGPTGLEFYERLACELKSYLNEGGKVWMELGYTQGPAVSKLFVEAGWQAPSITKDWAGHDRFFFLET